MLNIECINLMFDGNSVKLPLMNLLKYNLLIQDASSLLATLKSKRAARAEPSAAAVKSPSALWFSHCMVFLFIYALLLMQVTIQVLYCYILIYRVYF